MTDEPRQKFNPANRHDAMCEIFRKKIVQMAIDAETHPIYETMSQNGQLNAFAVGCLTGVIGVLLASVKPSGHDAIMEGLIAGLPMARAQAENIMECNARRMPGASPEQSSGEK